MFIDLTAPEQRALADLATRFDMSPNAIVRAALRLYQAVSLRALMGERMVFVDADGHEVDAPAGIGVVD